MITFIYYAFDVTVNFDTRLRDLLLLTFFSTIGLSAKIGLLREGGKALGILLVTAVVLLILQDVTGVLLAMGFGVLSGIWAVRRQHLARRRLRDGDSW